jgi:hypothetical protein
MTSDFHQTKRTAQIKTMRAFSFVLLVFVAICLCEIIAEAHVNGDREAWSGHAHFGDRTEAKLSTGWKEDWKDVILIVTVMLNSLITLIL